MSATEVGAAKIKQRHSKGRYASIVVMAEGVIPKEGTLSVARGKVDAFGHAQLGGIGRLVADLKGDVIVLLGEAVTEPKTVGPAFLDEAAAFFG